MQFSPHEPCNAQERFIALIPKVCTTALPGTHQLYRCINASARQIPYGFVRFIRNPDGCQIAGAMKDRKLLGIPTIGLDAIARLSWNPGGRNDGAGVAKLFKLPVNDVAATARLVAKLQPPFLHQSLGELGNIGWSIRYRAKKADRPIASILGDRHRNAGFVNIQSHKQCFIHTSSLGYSMPC